VRVDGVVVEEPQHRVSTQTVSIDAHASLLNVASVTLIMNKPPGWTDGLEPLPPTRSTPEGRKPAPPKVPKGPYNVRRLLTAGQHSAHDASGVRLLKSHLLKLDASVPLEYEASGLVPFTQDFRVQRKLVEDMPFMEHELIVDVRGELSPEALRPIERAMRDASFRLPDFKISVGSTKPDRSKLRLAVKGSHLGLAVYLCELAGFEILALRRIRLGRVSLGDLEEGTWRYLSQGERF
jgi:23S rRNA pseudouridine2604 synthase